MKLHGREIKVGDKAWSIVDGHGRAVEMLDDDGYIVMEFDMYPGVKMIYLEDGRHDKKQVNPTLYWNEIPLPDPITVEPPKAKRKLYMWAYESGLHSSNWCFFSAPCENEEQVRKEYNLGPSKKVQRIDNVMIEVE